MSSRPTMQRTIIADNGVTIKPLSLALTAKTPVFVMTWGEIEDIAKDDIVLCEQCEEIVSYNDASLCDGGGYICQWCIDDNKPKVYETEM